MIENPVPWPDRAKCAVALTFDMDGESIMHLHYPDSADNLISGLSDLRYGPEVAVPRILEVFRRFGLRQTFFIPGWCVETYPDTVEKILKLGHEIGHHGYLHEKPNELEPDEERYWFERAIDSIVRATGVRPKGFRAPSYGFSKHTLAFLTGQDFTYDSSLMGDDVPYLLEHGTGSLVELPTHRVLDDWTYFILSREFNWMLPIWAPQQALESYRAEFDAMWRHGGLWIAVWHPFISGRPARCEMMVKLIEHMQQTGDVWFATLDQIANHVLACINDGSWKPRVQRYPYVVSPIPQLRRDVCSPAKEVSHPETKPRQ